ncbi:MAG TPA: hypothetical protein VEJ23_07910 [Solirubrobacteraceae bacterium]|nr:hypothetical protein [Solirubrobacteraceae bacterium]
MESSEIIEHYPLLYHMAEASSWDSISQHGLLSTRSLIDLFELNGDAQDAILRTRRPASVPLHHDVYGDAVVRDQIPLNESRLAACLTDMTLEEWLDALNSRVFFWLDEDHLETLLGAREYRDDEHDVITVDTARLLDRHADRVTLSPINSGATMYKPPPRGRNTFLPIASYPFDERRRARGVGNAIVELAVDGGVPDIRDVAVRVERRRAGAGGAVIWELES